MCAYIPITTSQKSEKKSDKDEQVEETDEEVTIRTGFEAIVRKKFSLPMPEQHGWGVTSIEELEAFEMEDPKASKRFLEGGKLM